VDYRKKLEFKPPKKKAGGPCCKNSKEKATKNRGEGLNLSFYSGPVRGEKWHIG